MSLANPIPDPGGKISAPGVYDLTMARYHGDCAAGPSISSSGLRTIWSQSPAHYFLTSPYNPEPPEPEERPHFSLGRAAHHLLFLGRKGFDDEFVTRPEIWSDWRTKDAKAWREAALADGKTVITAGELEQIVGMAKTLGAHPMVKAGILDGYVERSLIWRDRETGVWLKSRPDNVAGDGLDMSDLKTTTDVSTEAIARTIASFSYHAQGALVGMACRELLQREMQTFTLVFVETKPPHCVRVITLKPDDIVRGERQVRAAIAQFAHATATGNWPGPGGDQQDAEYLDLPEWSRRQIDSRLELIEATAPQPFPHAAE
jgi:hypothetical protein